MNDVFINVFYHTLIKTSFIHSFIHVDYNYDNTKHVYIL